MTALKEAKVHDLANYEAVGRMGLKRLHVALPGDTSG
jgi:hypothetical protein